jgi:hypothetical protein
MSTDLSFTIGQGTTSPSLDFAVTPSTIVLTGATAVFRRRPVGTTEWVQVDTAEIAVDIGTPTLRYVWASGDTDVAGLFEAQFVVTYTDSTTETFPSASVISLTIAGAGDERSTQIAQVRFLLGDADFVLTNTDISFALDQTSNIYAAAAICARALSARYARRVDSKFETVESKFSQLRDNYEKLARQLDSQAKRRGGMGAPLAGGIRQAEVERVDADTDRVKPFFGDSLFNNPPAPNA